VIDSKREWSRLIHLKLHYFQRRWYVVFLSFRFAFV
jgi:hypothetical protein